MNNAGNVPAFREAVLHLLTIQFRFDIQNYKNLEVTLQTGSFPVVKNQEGEEAGNFHDRSADFHIQDHRSLKKCCFPPLI